VRWPSSIRPSRRCSAARRKSCAGAASRACSVGLSARSSGCRCARHWRATSRCAWTGPCTEPRRGPGGAHLGPARADGRA
jgi:hypothetical protein